MTLADKIEGRETLYRVIALLCIPISLWFGLFSDKPLVGVVIALIGLAILVAADILMAIRAAAIRARVVCDG